MDDLFDSKFDISRLIYNEFQYYIDTMDKGIFLKRKHEPERRKPAIIIDVSTITYKIRKTGKNKEKRNTGIQT